MSYDSCFPLARWDGGSGYRSSSALQRKQQPKTTFVNWRQLHFVQLLKLWSKARPSTCHLVGRQWPIHVVRLRQETRHRRRAIPWRHTGFFVTEPKLRVMRCQPKIFWYFEKLSHWSGLRLEKWSTEIDYWKLTLAILTFPRVFMQKHERRGSKQFLVGRLVTFTFWPRKSDQVRLTKTSKVKSCLRKILNRNQ